MTKGFKKTWDLPSVSSSWSCSLSMPLGFWELTSYFPFPSIKIQQCWPAFCFLNFPSLSYLKASVLIIFLLLHYLPRSWLAFCHHWAWLKCDTSTPHPRTAIQLIRQKEFSVSLTCFLVFMEFIISEFILLIYCPVLLWLLSLLFPPIWNVDPWKSEL